jgi:hypothetical protein
MDDDPRPVPDAEARSFLNTPLDSLLERDCISFEHIRSLRGSWRTLLA